MESVRLFVYSLFPPSRIRTPGGQGPGISPDPRKTFDKCWMIRSRSRSQPHHTMAVSLNISKSLATEKCGWSQNYLGVNPRSLSRCLTAQTAYHLCVLICLPAKRVQESYSIRLWEEFDDIIYIKSRAECLAYVCLVVLVSLESLQNIIVNT